MAQFAVAVGTDLFGTKRNIKLEFPRCPAMSELINAVESQYDIEMRSCRPAGYPDIPYKVQTFQLYDDVLQRWVDLYSSAQLTSGCTVFCFQPESIWHSDAQGIIPDPKDNVTWTTPTGSPRRARIATDAGVAPTLSEKLRSVFYEADGSNKGYVLYADLKAAFAKCDIEFTYATVGELFTAADANKSGHITYDEWVAFAIKYPAVIDALFFRSRDVKGEQQQSQAADAAAQAQRQAELRAMYERQQWAQPPPAPPSAAAPPPAPEAMRQAEAEYEAQRASSTAAAQRQAELQEAADGQVRAAGAAEQRLRDLDAQLNAQREVLLREQQAASEAQAALEAQRKVLQEEAGKQAEMQARLEQLKRQDQEAAASRARDEEEAARQVHAAEAARAAAAEKRAAEMAAQETARKVQEDQAAAAATAEYEKARRDADEARMAKEMAERREREAWDKLHQNSYKPTSPNY